MKKLLIAAGFVLAATSASLAQSYPYRGYGYYGAPYGYGPYDNGPGVSVYDDAPGYYAAPYGYDYGNGPYQERGGPGPRVGNGTGMGAGAER
jgi:hypothetical protein